MPVFWIGFNISMFPAERRHQAARRLYGDGRRRADRRARHSRRRISRKGSGMLIVAQAAGRRGLGRDPDERLHGGLRDRREWRRRPHVGAAVLGAGAGDLARMATVATGFNGDPTLKAVLQWTPTVCWAIAGAALLYLAVKGVQRWAAKAS